MYLIIGQYVFDSGWQGRSLTELEAVMILSLVLMASGWLFKRTVSWPKRMLLLIWMLALVMLIGASVLVMMGFG